MTNLRKLSLIRRTLAHVYLTAVCGVGCWAVVAALISGHVNITLLPLGVMAFFCASVVLRLSMWGKNDWMSLKVSHLLIFASSLAFSPLGGVFIAVFAEFGRIAARSETAVVCRPVYVMSGPAAAAVAGIAFGMAGGNLPTFAAGWSFVSAAAAALAYASIHLSVDAATAITEGMQMERATNAFRVFLSIAALGYLLSLSLLAAPAGTISALALASAGLAAASRASIGRSAQVVTDSVQSHPDAAQAVAQSPSSGTESAAEEHPETKTELLDPLTGAANLRYLLMFLNREINRSARYDHPLSLLLLDVDGLAQINAAKGQEAGDGLLREAASRMMGMLRDYDLVARYYDDEFAVVLPETFVENAFDIALRIHQLLTEQEYEDPAGGNFTIRVSAGVASFPNHGRTTDELISSAHHALNRAKFSGGNQVCSCHKLAKAS